MTITQKTRRESWSKTKEKLGPRQREVYDLLRMSACTRAYGAMTAWEIAAVLQRNVYVVRPRLTELKSLGLIKSVALKHHPETRRREALWEVTELNEFDPNGQGKLL